MIEIDVSPNLFTGAVILSWHGMFAFAAVATAVFLVGRWARLIRIDPDSVYSIAVWAIVGGVVGARFFHVVDRWDLYSNTPWEALAFWQPGIAVWGGVLGGFVGGVAAALVLERLRKRRWTKDQAELPEDQRTPYEPAYPIGKIADITAPALILVLAVGRLGDIVNGEHCSKATDFFLGFVWTAPDTIARNCASGFSQAAQPSIVYEMLLSLGALWVIWKLRGRLRPDGMLFAVFLFLYSLIRFLTMYLREEKVWAAGLSEAQWVALGVLLITGLLIAVRARFTERIELEPLPATERGSRAERRRRHR